MIANPVELETAFVHLKATEDALEALRLELLSSNPALFPVVSGSYLRRIETLRSDIISYILEHPAPAPLRVRLAGPTTFEGTVRVGVLARLLNVLQQALLVEGEDVSQAAMPADQRPDRKELRALLGLNMVATQTGSFILALKPHSSQPSLFEEFDITERSVSQLIDHIAELSLSQEEFSGSRVLLHSLDKLSSLVQSKKLESIEIDYRTDRVQKNAVINIPVRDRIDTLLGRPREEEEKVQGLLISIDIDKNKCAIRCEGQGTVHCGYDEEIEDDLIPAVKKQVEVSGIIETHLDHPEKRTIKHIKRFRQLNPEDEEF